LASTDRVSEFEPASSLLLPDSFRRTVLATFGPAGSQWLADLQALVAKAAQRWDLVIEQPFPNLSYNYVTRARRAGGQIVVLKLGVPNPELASEAKALRFYDGHGAARLLDADSELGMLLLEHLHPGHTLLPTSLRDDDEATRVAARVMQTLWRPAPVEHSFPTISLWARGFERLRAHFEGGTGPFPSRLVSLAEAIYQELLGSPHTAVLLHGDLHHDNILAVGQGWLAIDPKGIVGEAAYETGALLRNPLPQMLSRHDITVLCARRAAILGEFLEMDRERILKWAFAQAVLSTWWSFEDSDPQWDAILPLAEQMHLLVR